MDRPMVFIYLSLVMGIIEYFIYNTLGKFLALAFVILLIVLIRKIDDKTQRILAMSFIVLGIFSTCMFFNIISEDNTISCRIVKEKNNIYTGKYGNRNLTIDTSEKLQLGQRYILEGQLNKDIDYEKGSIGYVKPTKVIKKDDDFISKTYKLKKGFYNKLIESGVGEEEASVILAISLGDSSYINYDKQEELNVLGVSHIISVSGLHLTLVYGVLKNLIGFKGAIIISLIYVFFTGGKPSTCRAFIMVLLLSLSPKLKKKYDGVSALAFAAFLLLIIKPYYLLDVGYVLSFLAVLGILMFNKKIKRKIYKLPDFIGSSLSLTISAMIFTTPYLILVFKKVSLGGIVSNIILIPFYTILVILGIIGFLVFKTHSIFYFVIKSINFIFLIVTYIEKFLLWILPRPLIYTYLDGIIILFMYLSYCLIKRGVKSLRFFPIVMLALVLKESYYIYPEISIIAGKKFDTIQVQYKDRNILIAPEKVKLKYVYENYGNIDRVYDEFENGMNLRLDEKYNIYVEEKGNEIEGIITYKNKRKKFIIKENYDKSCYMPITDSLKENKCDIIEVRKDEKNVRLGHYFGRYKVIGSWVIELHIF